MMRLCFFLYNCSLLGSKITCRQYLEKLILEFHSFSYTILFFIFWIQRYLFSDSLDRKSLRKEKQNEKDSTVNHFIFEWLQSW